MPNLTFGGEPRTSDDLPFRTVCFAPRGKTKNLSFGKSPFILEDRCTHTISCVGGNYEPQAPTPGCLGCHRNVFCRPFTSAKSAAQRCACDSGQLRHESGSKRVASAQHEGFAAEV